MEIYNGKRRQNERSRIISPAGDLEKLKIAFEYGADAVYIGGEIFGMRSAAKISQKKT